MADCHSWFLAVGVSRLAVVNFAVVDSRGSRDAVAILGIVVVAVAVAVAEPVVARAIAEAVELVRDNPLAAVRLAVQVPASQSRRRVAAASPEHLARRSVVAN